MIDISKDMIVASISDPGHFIEKGKTSFDEYVNDIMNLCAKELNIPIPVLQRSFYSYNLRYLNKAISFWRLYSQTGPWAHMLKEKI